MKAILLCGGVGKRMFPITEDKLLLGFLGKPLLQHQIEGVVGAGLNELVIVANPQNAESIERIAGGLPGVKANIVVQEKPLGIANALECAGRFLEGEILVLNPNDVFEGSVYASLIREAGRRAGVSCLIGYEVKDYFPGGYLVVDGENRLKRIVEKPARGEEPSNLVNILVHLHHDGGKLLSYIKKVQTTRDDAYECALDSMVREGVAIQVVPYRGFWAAIKYPWHIFRAVRHFLDSSQPAIAPSAKISPAAAVEGRVIIGDNVRVLENAVVRGPAYIGPGSIIGNNVLVREYSHVGANCVVGYCTEVKGSYVGDGCWFHSSYVGDSIIADDCSFGAGTMLANFRFDEKDIKVRVGDEMVDTGLDKFGTIMGTGSKTGINASILPGTRVGPNSFVGPHVCLTKDLGPNKMAVMEPRYRVIDKEIDLDVKKKQELMKKLESH
jgi:NDP-sugar pyrophosphorylase family protein